MIRLLAICTLLSPAAAHAAPEVLQVVTAREVVEREPVGVGTRFEVGTTMVAFLRIKNLAPPTVMHLVWYRDGKPRSRSELNIGRSKAWRTWARRRLLRAGRWRVEVQHDGKVIEQLAFVAGASGAPPAPVSATPKPAPVAAKPEQKPAPVAAKPEPKPAPVAAKPEPKPKPKPAPVAAKPEPKPKPKPARVAATPEPKPEPQPAPVVAAPEPKPAPKPVPVPVKPRPKPAPTAHARRPNPRAASRRPPDSSCRALVHLRLNDFGDREGQDTLLTADIDIGKHPSGSTTPGLVVHDGRTAHALRVVRREVHEEARHGRINRSWDMLMGRALPNGPVVTWHGYPATMQPPDARSPVDRDEANLLRVVSVLGPIVGVHASLQGHRPERFDYSRYASVRAPGRSTDPSELLGDDLRDRARRRAVRLRRADPPDVTAHDFRRSAFAVRAGELRLFTLMRERDAPPLRLDIPVHPPKSLVPHLPKRNGMYVAPDGCGRIAIRDGRIVAGAGSADVRLVRVHAPRARELLGVTWIPGDDRLDTARAERLWYSLGR